MQQSTNRVRRNGSAKAHEPQPRNRARKRRDKGANGAKAKSLSQANGRGGRGCLVIYKPGGQAVRAKVQLNRVDYALIEEILKSPGMSPRRFFEAACHGIADRNVAEVATRSDSLQRVSVPIPLPLEDDRTPRDGFTMTPRPWGWDCTYFVPVSDNQYFDFETTLEDDFASELARVAYTLRIAPELCFARMQADYWATVLNRLEREARAKAELRLESEGAQ